MSNNKNTLPKCDNCGGHKTSYNQEKEKHVCDNRKCPESPMNSELTYMS